MNHFTFLLLISSAYANREVQNHTIINAYESIDYLVSRLGQNNLTQVTTLGKIRRPQSLSILMNFDPDGTSSLHLLNNVNGIYWSDSGNCQHGQMYDPIIGCREIFCMEGYTLDANGCVLDPNFNKTQNNNKVPNEMQIELTIVHRLCFLELNNTSNCSKEYLNDENFLNNSKEFLANFLEVDSNRIQHLEIVSHKITKTEEKINSSRFLSLTESTRITFWIEDKLNPKEKDTIQLYFTLVIFAIEQFSLKFLNTTIKFSNVLEIKKSDYLSWCGESLDNKTYSKNFRILVSFEPVKRYFVFNNNTNMFYGPGYFYLTILYKTKIEKQGKGEHTYENIHTNQNNFESWSIDFSKLDYSDVTDYIIDPNNTALETSAILQVCDRAPKIRINCNNFTTFRIRKCEFFYFKHNRSYCWQMFKNKCYSIDEYEYDLAEPNKYIRICQYIPNNTIHYMALNRLMKSENQSLTAKISSWFSLIANVTSLISMLLTLVTYFLFKELRNIPGWNVINLTLALSLAQFSFFMGSFFNKLSFACFINSILTHYGFLTSFFWMNVIAFDLHRNFRDKPSLILLQTLKVKDRLPKYALYAWLCPLMIVLSALVIDISVQESIFDAPFRPCYAGYLTGCNKIKKTSLNQNNCLATENLVSKSCWIQNGRANLIFFGVPIGIIIFINGIYYFVTVYNIRKNKRKLTNSLRRFCRIKLPGDEEIKFYIKMACIMGFTWISGFILTTINSDDNIIFKFFLYLFIFCNGFTGSFIFVAFICRNNVRKLYLNFIKSKFGKKNIDSKKKHLSESKDTISSILESERNLKMRYSYPIYDRNKLETIKSECSIDDTFYINHDKHDKEKY